MRLRWLIWLEFTDFSFWILKSLSSETDQEANLAVVSPGQLFTLVSLFNQYRLTQFRLKFNGYGAELFQPQTEPQEPVIPQQAQVQEPDIHEAEFIDPIVPDATKGGNADDESADSEETNSDDSDPDAERIRAAYNKKSESASGVSRRLKMMARKKNKTRGPPPDSCSLRKIKTDDSDKYYTPYDDLGPYVTKTKKAKVSRPKFVTKPSTTMIQEGMNFLNSLFPTTTTTIIVPTSSARVVALESVVCDITATNATQQQQLAAHWESSCKQDNLRARNDDDEDPNDTQGGSEHQIASSMPSATHVGESLAQGESGAGAGGGESDKGKEKQVVVTEIDVDVSIEDVKGDKNEKLDCLFNLDDMFIDDWDSDDEYVEIEFV
ncbi:hypothetical protein L1987_15651 [Smallanthus sonchifolius]|uniref:Uncharacterized protein n=1 Tax=Smallanthus sonchifolius TaxID=185202 RepID=A0ACB9J9N3_9ASTR|nr:hypothetical protein L1987_15651 [Smallanthus sonchifolius]